jgi:hypothetical protein
MFSRREKRERESERAREREFTTNEIAFEK